MELTTPDKNSIDAVLGIDPTREVKRGFNKEKLAVGIPDTD